MDEFPVHWETVFADADVSLTTYRLRVPSGWLVTIRDISTNITSVQFLPDPQHIWTLET